MHSARARPDGKARRVRLVGPDGPRPAQGDALGKARRSVLLAAAGVGALWFVGAAVAQHTKLELVRLCDVPPGPVRATQITFGEKHKGLAGKRARLVEEIGNYSKGKCGQRMPSKSELAQECRAIIEGFGAKVAELNGEITAFCRTSEVGPWADLLNMRPSAEALNDQRARRNRDKVAFEVQRIEDARGPDVNFDTYAVEITGLPTKGPATPELLLAHIRQNLNSFFDHSASTFVPHKQGDATDWAAGGAAPLGSLMVFKIPGPGGVIQEQGAVVTSASSPTMWVFSPVKIGPCCPGEHPVSGNREFGIRSVGEGKYQIYTRAADRARDRFIPGEGVVFKGADKLWQSWQARVVDYVKANGGSATAATPVVHHPPWTEVQSSGLVRR